MDADCYLLSKQRGKQWSTASVHMHLCTARPCLNVLVHLTKLWVFLYAFLREHHVSGYCCYCGAVIQCRLSNNNVIFLKKKKEKVLSLQVEFYKIQKLNNKCWTVLEQTKCFLSGYNQHRFLFKVWFTVVACFLTSTSEYQLNGKGIKWQYHLSYLLKWCHFFSRSAFSAKINTTFKTRYVNAKLQLAGV